MNPSNKLIITAALTGAETTKADNPHLPITPEEIAQAAYDAYQAGASIVHLHGRDEDGAATQDIEIYRRIIELISTQCDLIIQLSTGGGVGMSPQERGAPLVLRPEMATLTTGTVNFGDGVFLNPRSVIEEFAAKMKDLGIKPEVEIFDLGMIPTAMSLVRKGLLSEPIHFDFVLGVPGGCAATVKNLLHMKETIPPNATWQVAGIGRHELPLAVAAIILGGHVRVGFEDNIYYTKGVLAESNAQLVKRIVRIARELGRDIATPTEARAILGLPTKGGC
ncbi:3-keto-5-aminohexanoate cleavage protein [Candidatus Acetothermia bacterium]|nr:3-keto-5-aminohexanoate cleavage protein [Candidatus Acetothermia bacterium]